MDTEQGTEHDSGHSRITTSGRTTTVKLAPRTRDVVVRGLHAYLTDPGNACELHGLMPPELVEATPGRIGSGDAVGDRDVRDAVQRNVRLFQALAELLTGHRVRLFGGPIRFSDLEVFVSSGRMEVGRQLLVEPYEPNPAAVVLTDLDRIERHTIALRNAVAARRTSIELDTP